jgi:hypothetical protein
MGRGRLIYKVTAELARLDSATIESDGNYDDAFREATSIDTDGDGIGNPTRKELASIKLHCQFEDGAWEALEAHAMGVDPESDIGLVFHFRQLEKEGLVNSDGSPNIAIGDRLVAIYNKRGSTKIHDVPSERPLYVTEARPMSYGMSLRNPQRNLLLVKFGERGLRG